MDQRIADLLALLDLETLEVNLFRGESRDIGSPQVFGGQVLGQALNAASRTVTGRMVHSLHAYFLRRGDFCTSAGTHSALAARCHRCCFSAPAQNFPELIFQRIYLFLDSRRPSKLLC